MMLFCQAAIYLVHLRGEPHVSEAVEPKIALLSRSVIAGQYMTKARKK